MGPTCGPITSIAIFYGFFNFRIAFFIVGNKYTAEKFHPLLLWTNRSFTLSHTINKLDSCRSSIFIVSTSHLIMLINKQIATFTHSPCEGISSQFFLGNFLDELKLWGKLFAHVFSLLLELPPTKLSWATLPRQRCRGYWNSVSVFSLLPSLCRMTWK